MHPINHYILKERIRWTCLIVGWLLIFIALFFIFGKWSKGYTIKLSQETTLGIVQNAKGTPLFGMAVEDLSQSIPRRRLIVIGGVGTILVLLGVVLKAGSK